jgi:hypothetical protein
MAKSDLDAAVAAENTQGRASMGNEGTKFSSPSASPASGTKVPRKNTQAGDPTASGTKANRANVQQTPAMEKMGAAHTIKGRYMKDTDPAAGLTQANGRIVSPSVIRSTQSFDQGIGTSY